MKIAVTGGSGAIGSFVCDELAAAGHEPWSLDRTAPRVDVEFRDVDLTSLAATREAVRGAEQVVHLAAIPDPYLGHSLEQVIGENTVTSYTVFEAARLEGIGRVVYGCSESSTGFGIHHVKLVPQYVPIDEQHPLWPHEAYSLSKHFGERIGANYAEAFGIEVVSLRYMWVWSVRAEDAAREIVARSLDGFVPDPVSGFGAHIAVRDVARAVASSVEYEFPPSDDAPFEAFFLSARDTFLPLPTLELLRRSFGECPAVLDAGYFAANPQASVFDIRKAARLLGWEPKSDWRHFDDWEF
ncbi:NAD-dependent epimerase/dehydratase family protein [Candidatus Poribacteria bacterium]|jgi:UDP-glucose 4-epimerase|nr:NAD-dependent epimerase/dehydratase family protein [Candidatus Poribacteria bacterium]MBT5712823.1 NAD-dependent epimerase/dehydratase family protein [Candidatus Poribacteria bacterium]MBT7100201.1 NAD-dependent epimerase/dehydratase family protein [Candidatus Poribacteria bacterium]MBT7808848.1 NAD-dependent epimerase/dehydratase family protein [Candidatus Poribacteria bacterium]